MLSIFSVKMSTPSRRFRIHRESTPRPLTSTRETPQPSQDAIARLTTKRNRDCRYCNRDHPLRKCFRFRRLPVQERIAVVRKHGYCFNCLAHSHRIRHCQSRERCGVCLGEHHTLLHRDSTTHRKKRQHPRSSTNNQRRQHRPSSYHQTKGPYSAATTQSGAPTIVINVAAKS